jgi:dTDP-L-rhamnose 4-epimerase
VKTLILGGAGFIGLHLTHHLLKLGHDITVLDCFLPQVHGPNNYLPAEIAPHVRLIRGDVADVAAVAEAITDAEAVVHLAAETGTGQSMYEVSRYERTNIGGSAILYELLTKSVGNRVGRIVVASSRAIYGEGAYICQKDGIVYPRSRPTEEKRRGDFEPVCPICRGKCQSIPTPETAPLQPASFYGITKQVQEQTALLFGRALQIPTFALRYQNVYGPGQSLNNPYTGILAVFTNLARVGRPIKVFEDGAESRDFVHVNDVIQATTACLTAELTGCHSLNVGSGQRESVLEVATLVNAYFGYRSDVQISGSFREGDVRHGVADLNAIKGMFGYEPRWRFEEGLKTFLDWACNFTPATAGYERSISELKESGLLHDRN